MHFAVCSQTVAVCQHLSICIRVCSVSVCLCVCQVNAKGSTLLSEICGVIKMRVELTGMPELRLGLNDKVLFESTGSKCSYL